MAATPQKTLREVVLSRIERTLRRTFGDDDDVIDDLDLKSDEELLTWFERICGLDLLSRRQQPDNGRPGFSRFWRLDPPGLD